MAKLFSVLFEMPGKRVAFWDNCLCERGTTVALFDYALYNKLLLKNDSIILYSRARKDNNDAVIAKFCAHFSLVIGVEDFSEVDTILKREKCDLLYAIKHGKKDTIVSRVCKTACHCVFECYEPHGDIYAAISQCVKGNEDGRFPVVPHIVSLPEHDRNMRKRLSIPESATVFGRYGGYNSFDIEYVRRTVVAVARSNPKIYFLFVNTRPFSFDAPIPSNIIHLPTIVDMEEKVEFINTCDAMLWARREGETFGLACAEFSIRNKPVFCTRVSTDVGDNAHVSLLGDKAVLYDRTTLRNLLLSFNRAEAAAKDWNAYRDYSPEKVMQTFERVFLDEKEQNRTQ